MVFRLFISLFRDGKGKIVFKEEAKQYFYLFRSWYKGPRKKRKSEITKLIKIAKHICLLNKTVGETKWEA